MVRRLLLVAAIAITVAATPRSLPRTGDDAGPASPSLLATGTEAPRPTAAERPVGGSPRHRSVQSRPVPAGAAPQLIVRVTWYCGHGSRCTRGYGAGCLCAAASPDLGSWLGKLVTVRRADRSVTVRIVDCNCRAHRALDLYAIAFARLAPLSVGTFTAAAGIAP